jgi:sarcosine oxidase subunit beta
MRPDVAIVGGGIQGLATAVHLAIRGLSVLVIEKNYCGRHASGVNAGGVMRLARRPVELPLSAVAMEIWADATGLVDDDCGFRAIGRLKIAESDGEMDKLRERHDLVRALGYTHETLLDRAELRDIEPGVAEHATGGIYSPGCGHANPFRTVTAFKRKAQHLGVRFREDTRVLGVKRSGALWRIDTTGGPVETPVLVNTAGAWADRIAAAMGEPVPMSTIAPMLMVTSRMAPVMRQRIGAVDRVLSIVQMPNGTVIIGGGYHGSAHRDAETTTLDYGKLAFNARIACEMFPALRHARIVRAWAGIEGDIADGLPVIGPSATEEGAFHAFGFCAHGFHLGPAVGRILAELVTTGASNVPIDAFRIDRFSDNAAA